ncbi:MAG: SpoIIE family protein phosphatase [Oscillospiraceae bacterium]|nr:SpoIIE family protein phosphatase [Oscillospiraceae bacterium]
MLKTKGLKKQKRITLLKNVPILLTVMLLSVVSAQSRIGGYLSFTNVMIASLSGIWGVFSFVGSVVSYISTGIAKEGFVQLGGMVIILGVKLISNRKENCLFDGILTTLSLLICTFASTIFTRYDSSLLVYRIVSSVLSGCVVYFSLRLKNKFHNDNKLNLFGIDGAVVSIIYILSITTLGSIQFYTMNMGRVAGIFITYLFAKKYRISGGGICGTLTAFGILLCSPNLAHNTLTLCACGVMAGVIAGFGKIPMTVSFLTTSVFGLVVAGLNDDTFMMLTDIAVATVLYLVFPDDAENAVFKFFSKRKSKSTKTIKTVSNRIDFASSAIGDVNNRIKNISKEIEKFKNKQDFESEDNTKQLRELLCNQLSITQDLLRDISNDTMGLEKCEEEVLRKAKTVFEKYNINTEGMCVYSDIKGNMQIEAYKQGRLNCDIMRLTVDLSIAVDCELSMPNTVYLNGITKLTFSKAPAFKITSGLKQISAEENDYCGDTIERIWISSSQYMVVLSDGMGTGKRAKLDSSFTTDLITRFTACGISPVTALKFTNSIMRVKGWDESFATADIALFDTCSGYVKFIKSGAFASYILRDGSLIKIETKTFPLGILDDITPSVSEYKIFDKDLIIVASDGADEKAIRFAVNEIKNGEFSPEQISDLMCEYVKEYSTKEKNDDISVCVLSVKEV